MSMVKFVSFSNQYRFYHDKGSERISTVKKVNDIVDGNLSTPSSLSEVIQFLFLFESVVTFTHSWIIDGFQRYTKIGHHSTNAKELIHA